VKAGELDYRVTIEQRTDAYDAIGHPTPTWTEIATVWGGVEYLSGKEVLASGREITSEQARVYIRYRSDVNTTARLYFDLKYWDIIYVRSIEIQKRKDGLELLVQHNV
jgi:SPP1 family predicted phage head-tail adaptor